MPKPEPFCYQHGFSRERRPNTGAVFLRTMLYMLQLAFPPTAGPYRDLPFSPWRFVVAVSGPSAHAREGSVASLECIVRRASRRSRRPPPTG